MAVALLLALGLAQSGDPYHWPLDLPRILTSSFAEYRPGRFHMGIDLRTGPIGKDVFAAGDGHVSRVRCSPYGYGKAIYLALDDGNSVVYAHLDDYYPELREYVRSEQHRRERYAVDLYPGADRFPVSRGQFIAKSGQTGIGVPHLHYEFRDAAGAPISPKLLGIDWPDTTRPVYRRAAVVPMGPGAWVNGDMLPVVLDTERVGAGQYRTAPVQARGTVGFAVDLIDPANGGATRLGVHTVDTAADGRPVFRIAHDRVSYANQAGGRVAYHPYLRDAGRFLVQWRWPGNRTAMYDVFDGDGLYAVPEGAHEIQITALDFHANAATLTIPLSYSPPVEPLIPSRATAAAGTLTYDTFGQHLLVTAAFDAPEPETPALRVDGSAAGGAAFARVNDRTFRGALELAETGQITIAARHPRMAGGDVELHAVRGGGAGVRMERGGAIVNVPADVAFGALFVALREGRGAGTDTLRMVDAPVELWPPDAPLAGDVRLSLPIPAEERANRRLLIYRRSGSGWSALTTARDGDRLVASPDSFGTFAILEDRSAPSVTIVAPADGAAVPTRRPRIEARVGDAGSGVDDYRLTANGDWLLATYDPETGRIAWEQDEDLPVGELELVLEVSDEAGNRTFAAATVAVAGEENVSASP